ACQKISRAAEVESPGSICEIDKGRPNALPITAEFPSMRSGRIRDYVLHLKPNFLSIGGPGSAGARDESARATGLIRRREWIVNRDQHHRSGIAAQRFHCRRETRILEAHLIDERLRNDEVVSVREGLAVSGFPLQRFSQTVAAAKLSQVPQTTELINNGRVVGLGIVVIEARAKDLITRGRAYQ